MRRAVLVAACLAAGAAAAPAAHGNGDPSSNVLIAADVYTPAAPASPDLVASLEAAARRARSAGYPAKVSVIGSPADMGNLASQFGSPQQYADYLAADLRRHPDTPRGFTMLVVMPAGAGIAGHEFDEGERRAARTIAVRSGATSDELVRAARVTLEKMAAAAGHPIGGAGGSGSTGASAGVLIGVVGGLLAVTLIAALAARARRRAQPPGEPPS